MQTAVGLYPVQRQWLSLLRQIVHSPEIEWERWERLRSVARAELTAREKDVPSRDLPAVPAIQLAHQPQHHIVRIP